jgi:hypothetical protein
VADGPFGVMGCHRPASVRHLDAGADALSVDEVVLGDMGVPNSRLAPIVRLVYHWFGFTSGDPAVDGERPELGRELRGAHASRVLRALGVLSYPVYVYFSDHGELFVPRFDASSFPPLRPIGLVVRLVQKAAQQAFGLRPPA